MGKYKQYIEMFKMLYEVYKAYKAGKKGEALVAGSDNVITRMVNQAKAGEYKLMVASKINNKRIEDLTSRGFEYDQAIAKAERIVRKLEEIFD